VPRLRRRLDAVTEASLIAELTQARTALVQAAARVPAIQKAGLQHWDPWIHGGRITASVRRSLLIGPAGPGRLRARLRAWHDRMGCPREPRPQAREPIAALAADFAALPLRATWLIQQLDRVVDGPGPATARAAGERWLRVRNALVETLQGFVVTLARRVSAWQVPLEDRIQAGTLAVVVAIERFDPTRGTRLTTYVGPVVERAIRRLGRRTPRRAVLASLGGSPTRLAAPAAPAPDGAGRATGSRARWCDVTVVTIDAQRDDGPHASWAERLIDPTSVTPEDLAILTVDGARARAELARLPPREQTVLHFVFGLGHGEALGIRAVGRVVGLSPATVRRIRDRALTRLARALTGSRTPASPHAMPFEEVSSCPKGESCPIRCRAACFSSSTSRCGPGARRSARRISASTPQASPPITPSGGSDSSRSTPSTPLPASSARPATRWTA
jgi:RNA polymerase sigma factor (sigma-70 family)